MTRSSVILRLRQALQALSIVALSVFASIPAGAAPDQDPTRFLERYLQGLTSLRADFTQVSSVAGGDSVEKASGRLYLQKSGRFRWDYREPNEQLIVSDGSNVWLFDKELEQVTVKPIDESLATPPALLLAGCPRERPPDADGDGVADAQDACPATTVPGAPLLREGCSLAARGPAC